MMVPEYSTAYSKIAEGNGRSQSSTPINKFRSDSRTNQSAIFSKQQTGPKPALAMYSLRVSSARPVHAPVAVHPKRATCPVIVARAVPTRSVDESSKDDSFTTPLVRIESRRIVLATAILLAGSAGKALALGKSAKELAREAKARREKLKAASAKMREKGKSENAFEESKFGLGETATTPNKVNRTGEGGSGI